MLLLERAARYLARHRRRALGGRGMDAGRQQRGALPGLARKSAQHAADSRYFASDRPDTRDRRKPEHRCHRQRYPRSEEHTSELQSLMRISYAVFCLTKKKQYTHTYRQYIKHITTSN